MSGNEAGLLCVLCKKIWGLGFTLVQVWFWGAYFRYLAGLSVRIFVGLLSS
jgi:hypothetical protein